MRNKKMENKKQDTNGKDLVRLEIDGIMVSVAPGTSIMDAAVSIGINIPRLCSMKGLRERAVCRLCTVECDGGGRLKAACATEVWEGAKVVTMNKELYEMRRTMLELILADHPEDCFVCDRNMDCELQSLAASLGIKQLGLIKESSLPSPMSDAETIIWDGAKCVKCQRCTAACQEEQEVRALTSAFRGLRFVVTTPYHSSLAHGPCVYCGRCIIVCPVSAASLKDDTRGLELELSRKGKNSSVIFSDGVQKGLEASLSVPEGSIGRGQLVTILKRLGFEKVYDRGEFLEKIAHMEALLLQKRLSSGENLPLISCCSDVWGNFMEAYYPMLIPNMSDVEPAEGLYGKLVNVGGEEKDSSLSAVISTCLARKAESYWAEANETSSFDFALTVRELVRMIKMMNLSINSISPSPFDHFNFQNINEHVNNEIFSAINVFQTIGEMGRIFEGKTYKRTIETRVAYNGGELNFALVFGTAAARVIFEKIKKDPFKYSYVKVMSCPEGCIEGGGQSLQLTRGYQGAGTSCGSNPETRKPS
jgi:NADH-quinone oxidoreductase subunit G/NADP-reducing hydrogenase subunit HndD